MRMTMAKTSIGIANVVTGSLNKPDNATSRRANIKPSRKFLQIANI